MVEVYHCSWSLHLTRKIRKSEHAKCKLLIRSWKSSRIQQKWTWKKRISLVNLEFNLQFYSKEFNLQWQGNAKAHTEEISSFTRWQRCDAKKGIFSCPNWNIINSIAYAVCVGVCKSTMIYTKLKETFCLCLPLCVCVSLCACEWDLRVLLKTTLP